MTLRLLMLVALIGIAIALTDWLQDLREELQRAPAASRPGAPDYAFHQVLLTVMGLDGMPRYRIRTPRMAHFPVTESSLLLAPTMWFFRNEGPPVEMCARRAKVFANGERVWLPGEVHIMQRPHAERPRMKIDTREMTVFPKSKKARTEARVVAASGQQRLQGVGMMLDLSAGTLNLESRVRGTYVP